MLFVHLSDIHFRTSEIAYEDDPNAGLRDDIINDVRTMRERIDRPADAILISGDIAFSGAAEEYDFAYAWLEEKLCPAAGCGLREVFVIPGNHDIDRRQGDNPAHRSLRRDLRAAEPDQIDSRLREYLHHPESARLMLSPLNNYNKFAAKFLCAIGPYDPKQPLIKPYVMREYPLDDGMTLKFWGFSSVLVSDAADNERLMFVDPRGKQIAREDDVVHAVMCHHPYSWLRNGADFQTRLEEVTQVQLFGHEHTSRVTPARDFTLVRAGAVHPERDAKDWSPGYNWVELAVDTKDDGTRALNVSIWVRKWENHRFIPVPDRKERNPWPISHELPRRTARPAAPQAEAVAPVMAEAGDARSRSPSDEPVSPHAVARNMLSLAEHEQREIIVALHLDEEGDQGLQDYEFVLAAINRAIERGDLEELNKKTNDILRRKSQ